MERFRGLLDSLVQDIRFAVRKLSKTPAFTAVAALSIALGTRGLFSGAAGFAGGPDGRTAERIGHRFIGTSMRTGDYI